MAQGSSNPTTDIKKIGGTNIVTGGTAGTQAVGGVQAHDAAASGNNPVLIGGVANTASPVAVASGDVSQLWTTTTGALNIADAGGSLTVDAPIGTPVHVRHTDGTNTMPTADVAARSSFHRVTDGTNTAAVKAASTAAAAADPSLVVGLSPNSPLPAGTNGIGKLTSNDGVDIGDVTINNLIGNGVFTRVTDGTNTMPTADVAARSSFHRVTDGTNTAAVKAASTAAAAADPSLVVGLSPNSPLPAGTNGIGKLTTNDGVDIGDVTINNTQAAGVFSRVTDGTNTAAVKAASTAAVAGDTALVVAVSPNNTVNTKETTVSSTATALGALNASVTLDVSSNFGAGMVVTAISAPSGITLTPSISYDGGTNWVTTYFDNPNGDKESTIPNASLAVGLSRTIVTAAGATHVRIQATAWTSGSATVQLRGTQLIDPSVLFAATNNTATRPPTTAQVGGWDGTNLRAISTNASGHVNIADGGNSITVDAPIGTPVFTRVTDGTNTMPTGDAAARGIFNRITDGTNSAAVKAASTAALAADPSLVVGLSPNSPLPAGTNGIGKLTVNDGIDIGDVTINNLIGNGVYTRVTDGTNTMPTADVAARSSFHRVTDGTNTAAVKAASTAALATDPSLVVGLSPNSSLPAGTNGIGKLTTNDGVDIGDVTINNAIGNGVYTRVTDGTNTMPTGDAAARGIFNRVTDGTNTAAVKAASTAAVAADPSLVVGLSPNSSLPTGTNNIGTVELASKATGPNTNATTSAYAASLVIKASAGTLYMLTGYSSRTTAQFIQLHNATSLPANGSVPVVVFRVPETSNFSFDLGAYGRAFSTGIVACVSSTGPTLTVGSADTWFDAQFR